MSEFGKLNKLVNGLLERAEKAESALESVQKMCDHWEAKAAERQQQVNEWQAAHLKRETLVWNADTALNAADVEIYHPADACGERKLMTLAERVQWLAKMTLAERIQWLAKSRDDWKRIACDNEARAVNAETQWEEWEEKAKKLFDQYAQVRDALEKSEADRDEWKRRAGNAEFEVKRQRDLVNPVDWKRVRIEVAMQGALAPEAMVYFADGLIAKLQKKEVEK